jgi:hypothetical protein
VSPFLKKSWILSSINTRLLPSLQLLRPNGTIRTVKTTSAKLGNQQRLQHIELCHILFVFGFFFFVGGRGGGVGVEGGGRSFGTNYERREKAFPSTAKRQAQDKNTYLI